MLPEKVKKCLSRMSGKLSRTVLRRGKGNPYDNAVSEATNKILKIEFIYHNKFVTVKELELQLAEYIYWYNYIRIHGSLGYVTPIEYRNEAVPEMAA